MNLPYRARRLRLEILLAIHANQLEEIAQRERADEQAEEPNAPRRQSRRSA